MTDSRLKIWIDLGKWLVVSVLLVVMTKIIDCGFKDREVGIKEIKEYDKYIQLVTDNAKVSERRLLAQYFSNVTVSRKLKKGWLSYFEIVSAEYDSILAVRNDKMKKLELMDSTLKNSTMAFMLEDSINMLDEELIPSFKRTNNYSIAIEWELKGFKHLLDKNLFEAIKAFEYSESSYNSFHQVYEIARFLRNKLQENSLNNELFWLEIYKEILASYSWKMPIEIRDRMEEIIS